VLRRGLPCEHGPTCLKQQYIHMLASDIVRNDLDDDRNITGIPRQVEVVPKQPTTMTKASPAMVPCVNVTSSTVSEIKMTPMINVPLTLRNQKYKELSLLLRTEEQLSITLNFQCQLLKSLPATNLTNVQQLMLQNLLSKQDLPPYFSVSSQADNKRDSLKIFGL